MLHCVHKILTICLHYLWYVVAKNTMLKISMLQLQLEELIENLTTFQ